MQLHHGRISDVAQEVGTPGFAAALRHRFEALYGETPSAAEVRSWSRSWPALLAALLRAGLGDLHVLLEYSLPACGKRIDALIVGESSGGRLTAVIVELKQWTEATIISTMSGAIRVADRIVQHPARQVGGYAHHLRNWVSRPDFFLHVEGLAILHDAPEHLIARLRETSAAGISAGYPVLGRSDLEQEGEALAATLRCAALRPPSPALLDALLNVEHRPSRSLLERAGAIISGHDALTLIDEQDLARQYILRAAESAKKSRRKGLIVVTGGPGTGKTAIACRLFGDLCAEPGHSPRLFSPSGTITKQFKRILGEDSQGLIDTFGTKVPNTIGAGSVVLLDEAHRARTYPSPDRTRFPIILGNLIERAAVTVLFVDESQIVRPTEGIRLAELKRHAEAEGLAFIHFDLSTQFRCNGSAAYLQWINAFLAPVGTVSRWSGSSYDLAVAENPDQFTRWIKKHTEDGEIARITAGFCWPWESSPMPPLLPEVQIAWSTPNGVAQWLYPWNAGAEELDDIDVPARAFWATDPGGHNQVGCIYTAQGMEYAYSVVIIGNDLVRRADRWVAQPQASHDRALNTLPPARYLTYALNIYRVLATRGTKATRLYSTDPETQAYLRSVLPAQQAERGGPA